MSFCGFLRFASSGSFSLASLSTSLFACASCCSIAWAFFSFSSACCRNVPWFKNRYAASPPAATTAANKPLDRLFHMVLPPLPFVRTYYSRSVRSQNAASSRLCIAQVGLGLFARVRQAGHAPGVQTTVKQVVHPVPVAPMLAADIVHRRRDAELRVVFAQRANDFPVFVGEFDDVELARDFARDRFIPLRGVFEQAVVIEIEDRRVGNGIGHGASPCSARKRVGLVERGVPGGPLARVP